MNMRSVRHALVLCGIVALQPACSYQPVGIICTEIGCSSGFSVEVKGAGADAAQVTVLVEGQAQRTFTCTANSASCMAFYDNSTPSQVTVQVMVRGAQKVTTVQPVYTVRTPNGPDCPPKCNQGNIVVQV